MKILIKTLGKNKYFFLLHGIHLWQIVEVFFITFLHFFRLDKHKEGRH